MPHFQSFKMFPSTKFLSQKYLFLSQKWLSDLENFPVFFKPLPYLKERNFSDSVQKRENTDRILSIHGKIRVRESPYFGTFHAKSCWTFSVITCIYAKKKIICTRIYELFDCTKLKGAKIRAARTKFDGIKVINYSIHNISRRSRPEGIWKKDFLRNFARFTVKHLYQSLFFNKIALGSL